MTNNQISPVCGPASAPLSGQPNPTLRILVVEDDEDIRHLNTNVLERVGYHVDAAEDGDAGWKALSAEYYDLVITDNKMPNLTGVELLKKLRAARMAMPVIMATGTLQTEEFIRTPWLESAAMLPKPYTVEELLETVKDVLREANMGETPHGNHAVACHNLAS